MSGMTDEEMAVLTERLSGVPAASVLRALAAEYDEATRDGNTMNARPVSSEDVHREATE